ncbi:adenylyl-sulfate kinase [Dissulfurirhabdus thermomarina]|uniref:Adenylyl-sulfate kinase n=1 Tax=Dissulfurirhabdus thermomarina TaxID=1765737 RepID=A0A6N9TLE4_DISTH|nr:adenylyl-sulfate kinase [Dissulfurirhabdus thermomarina]NDY41868.1 adenylyl-sulfate kinase [Dissulfurirhabdus thermomarina]NMX22569.1 adenylyl-sulfate kinase [Dissulfurirhabdus thermomarina]
MSFTIWFTGLSGAGKTTLSRRVYLEIRRRSLRAELLDGDIIRCNFSQELGFTRRDRDINVRRIGFVSYLLTKNDVISVVAAIAPYAEARAQNRRLIGRYVEVFCDCPLEVVERRDVKGLYARARAGEIPNFTGVSDPYEPPEAPEVVVRTDRETVEESTRKVLGYLEEQGLLPPAEACRRCDYSEADEAEWRRNLVALGFARREG